MLPQRKKRQKMGVRQSDKVECPGHCRWVRTQFQCAISGKSDHECYGPTETHHVTTRGAGGGDDQVVPLCSRAHFLGHSMGWETFAAKYSVDLPKMAADLWKADTYHRQKYEREQLQQAQVVPAQRRTHLTRSRT